MSDPGAEELLTSENDQVEHICGSCGNVLINKGDGKYECKSCNHIIG